MGEKKERRATQNKLALCLAFGPAFGLILGLAVFDNIGLGVFVGIGLGAAIGSVWSYFEKKDNDPT